MTTGRINQVASVTDPHAWQPEPPTRGSAGQRRRRASCRATESYEGQKGNTGPVSATCTAPARTGHSHGAFRLPRQPNAGATGWRCSSKVGIPLNGNATQEPPTVAGSTNAQTGNPGGTAPRTPWGCKQAEGSEGDESAPRGRFSNTNPDRQRAKAPPREHPAFARQ
ncbi:hypothetical protein PIB30_097729, partial [Stylosanthes scabra]|nr:hypothetical protein [Stylosanthes scabra]